MREYRNVKRLGGSYPYYDCELWIDGKFIQACTFSEVHYRERVLMLKLETLLDADTLKEVEEVMQLKYDEGCSDGQSFNWE